VCSSDLNNAISNSQATLFANTKLIVSPFK